MDYNAFINEYIDRENRSKNIVLYNIEESESLSDETEKYNLDLEKIDTALKVLNLGINSKDIKIRRLGKFFEGKKRPIKVFLSNKESALKAIKNKRKLNEQHKDIYVSLDQTAMQREYYKKIRSELVSRKGDGESDLFIKYINNMPTIAKRQAN